MDKIILGETKELKLADGSTVVVEKGTQLTLQQERGTPVASYSYSGESIDVSIGLTRDTFGTEVANGYIRISNSATGGIDNLRGLYETIADLIETLGVDENLNRFKYSVG